MTDFVWPSDNDRAESPELERVCDYLEDTLDRLEATEERIRVQNDKIDSMARVVGVVNASGLVRYCYECGTIGEIDREKHINCCPDGNRAQYVRREVAEQAREGFLASIRPPVPEESRPLPVNRYGVDRNYFTKNLEIIIRDMRDYTASELARSLGRLALTANSETMREPEFNIGNLADQPKYHGPEEDRVPVDVAKVATDVLEAVAEAAKVSGPLSESEIRDAIPALVAMLAMANLDEPEDPGV